MARRTIQRDAFAYYVYEILVDGIVRYVGKGLKYRIKRHVQIASRLNRKRAAGETVKALKFHNRLAKAMLKGHLVSSSFIATGLTHRAALDLEMQEISKYPAGHLWNETLGGEGLDSESAKRLWRDPNYRAKRLAEMRSEESRARARKGHIEQFSDPAARAEASKRSKKLWSDPETRTKITKAVGVRWTDPEFRERHRQSTIRHWDEVPGRREARAEITRAYASTPEFRAATRTCFKKSWEDPEFRKKTMAHWNDPARKKAIVDSWTLEFLKKRGEAIAIGLKNSAAAKRARSNPETIRKLREANKRVWSDPAARAKQSEKMKALWMDPEHRAKTTAHWAEKRRKRLEAKTS